MTDCGYLVLEDGTVFKGLWHGPEDLTCAGEVVFNTSMQGYQEIVTDPSYFQQIVVMTAPEQGNYGVNTGERESKRVHAEGFVCVALNDSFTAARGDFGDELEKFQRPALSDIDTRALTLHLRARGTPWGAMFAAHKFDRSKMAEEILEPIVNQGLTLIAVKKNEVEKKWQGDWVYAVSGAETVTVKGSGPHGRVAVLDYGAKENISRELGLRFKEIALFNSRATARDVLDWAPDGVMLTNGPGDPAEVKGAVEALQGLLGQVPIFGICMGHQILALAAGCKTYKLKFGHRGANHPVHDFTTGAIYMTSQNHGYAVDDKALGAGVVVNQVNLYDKTIEGIEVKGKNAWSVQYHPESCPGPHDARNLFDRFRDTVLK